MEVLATSLRGGLLLEVNFSQWFIFFRKPSLRDTPCQSTSPGHPTIDHLALPGNPLIIPKTFSSFFLTENHYIKSNGMCFLKKTLRDRPCHLSLPCQTMTGLLAPFKTPLIIFKTFSRHFLIKYMVEIHWFVFSKSIPPWYTISIHITVSHYD